MSGHPRTRIAVACFLSFLAGGGVMWATRDRLTSLGYSVVEGRGLCFYDLKYADGGLSPLEMEYECPPLPVPMRFLYVAIVLACLGVVLAVLFLVARLVLRPLAAMASSVRQLGPQNLGQRVSYHGPNDEVRELADALNEMLDRVATGFESQRRFAANASHELRTPLAAQRTLVEVAVDTGSQNVPALAAQLLAVNARSERVIEGLLVLAESDRGLRGTEPVRLDELVDTVLNRLAEEAGEHSVTLRRTLAVRTVHGDRVLLERLVTNLVDNAIKYNEPHGVVEVVVAGTPALTVRNTGQRVPAKNMHALFEPFHRLNGERGHRDGAGLGLAIVRSIATAHHGTATAEPGERGGLVVTVHLP
ncbi:MAG: HAMP domain-containing histidine kinase [Actinomycetota bacterium]|nr:HAMP domain-containing histidine kinase [Actinomycetota bacterium]